MLLFILQVYAEVAGAASIICCSKDSYDMDVHPDVNPHQNLKAMQKDTRLSKADISIDMLIHFAITRKLSCGSLRHWLIMQIIWP